MSATKNCRPPCHDALHRLERGESGLAIHPGCGTNYLTSGAAASLGALTVLSIGDRKARWSRLPDVLIAATLALIVAQPIGPKLQEHITTCADMGDLEIVCRAPPRPEVALRRNAQHLNAECGIGMRS